MSGPQKPGHRRSSAAEDLGSLLTGGAIVGVDGADPTSEDAKHPLSGFVILVAFQRTRLGSQPLLGQQLPVQRTLLGQQLPVQPKEEF
jgi:hypothetical protein